MDPLSFQEKYNVLGTQDPSYEGLFITAVKTTGISAAHLAGPETQKRECGLF